MHLRKSYWLLPILVLSYVLFLTASIPPVSTGTWQTWNNMGDVRSGAAAVLLQDGRVFIIGGTSANGPVASADLFGTDGVFSAAAAMQTPRSGHTATVLSDGRVLVTSGTTSGGGAVNTAEIYDPSADSWSAPATTVDARAGHTASLLSDGRVLLAGGHDSAGNALSSLEIFDPASGKFSSAGAMSVPRMNHAAATLGDGRVLIIGGTADGTNALASIDIYDPSAGTVSAGPVLSTPRMSATATTTLDGKVAVIGGNNGAASGSQDLASAEIFDSTTGQFSPSASNLVTARSGHQAFLLPKNNAILVLGGSSAGTDLNSAELYYSWADSFHSTGAMNVARPGLTGSAIGLDGRFLAAGGTGLASTELYGFATVKTDAADYPPGSTVTITGSGWQPGETVTLTLLESPLIDTPPAMTAVADGNGNISNNQFSPDSYDVNVRFYLTAVGSRSGLQAQNTFTDAGPKPTTTITFPTNGGSYNSTGWTGTIAGTGSFATGTTGRGVNVSVKRNGTTNKFWNGSGFTSSSQVFFSASGTTSWTFSFPFANFPANDSYTVQSQATDSNGTETGNTTATFTIDTTPPAAPSNPSLASGSDTGSSQSDGITNITTNLKFNGTAEANSTVNLFVDGSSTSSGTGTTNNGGSWNNINVAGPLSEGTHTIRATATDQAGNVSVLSSPLTITIDTTAPTMGLSPASGTVNTPFSFSWSITDPTSGGVSSGVNTSTCLVKLDGTTISTACSGNHSITTGGAHTVTASATDIAGNAGLDTRSYMVVTDSQAPVVTITFSAVDGQNGWYVHSPVLGTASADDTTTGNSNVTAISCTDGVNPLPVGSPTGIGTHVASGSLSVSGEGTHNISCTATDSAGNTGAFTGSTSMPVVVKIDTVAPVLTATRLTAANANGWNNTNVNVEFTCTDSSSGVASIAATGAATGNSATSPLDVTVTTEGAGQSVSGSCKDNAGNSATTASVTNINIDKTKPVITGGRTPAANANGWNNTDVTVNFTCAETGAVQSGIDTNTVAGATVSTEGANQSVTNTGSCVDVAGNAAGSSTVSGINIDKTPPNAPTPVRTPAANGAGWNNTDVNVSFTSNGDAGAVQSGIDSCTTSSNLTAETSGTDVSGTCTDKAGNVSAVAKVTVKIDKTKPVITGSRNPAPNGFGWNNTDVTVSFTCAETGAVQSGIDTNSVAGQTVTGEVENLSVSNTGSCTDVAGNVADSASVGPINIDRTAPNAPTGHRSPSANAAGWNNFSPVAVTFTDNGDAGSIMSGIDTCTALTNVTGETAGTDVNGTCTDKAGNTSAPFKVTVKIDLTKPVITGSRNPAPNVFGWNNVDVTVSFTCAETGAVQSGIGTNSAAGSTVSTEGMHQSVTNTGSCVDVAGNTADSATVNEINIDKTKPTAGASASPGPNVYGWNNTNVTVTFTGSDSLSGIASCDAPVTLSSEGTNLSASGTCKDKADNVSDPASVTGINIDKTLPVITGSRTPLANSYGWNNMDVTVSFACADAGSVQSGIATNTVAGATLSGEGAGQSFTNTGTCTDKAGNSAVSSTVSGINIDKTNPTITLTIAPGSPAATGWYNISTGQPTVSFTCNDALSGVASCTPPVLVGEGANQTISGTAMDKAGNSASTSIMHVNVDVTAPTISLVNPANGGNYLLNQSAVASYSCADTGSSGLVAGSVGCGGPVASGSQFNTASVGSKSFTVNAKDVAGNTAMAISNYSVLYSTGACLGDLGHTILQPINATGTMSVFKLGSTVPTKFRVCDANGVSIGTAGVVTGYGLVAAASTPGITADEDVYSTTPDTAFRWDSTGQQWIFNQSTKNNGSLNQPGTTYYFGIHLNDGSWIYFQYGLK